MGVSIVKDALAIATVGLPVLLLQSAPEVRSISPCARGAHTDARWAFYGEPQPELMAAHPTAAAQVHRPAHTFGSQGRHFLRPDAHHCCTLRSSQAAGPIATALSRRLPVSSVMHLPKNHLSSAPSLPGFVFAPRSADPLLVIPRQCPSHTLTSRKFGSTSKADMTSPASSARLSASTPFQAPTLNLEVSRSRSAQSAGSRSSLIYSDVT